MGVVLGSLPDGVSTVHQCAELQQCSRNGDQDRSRYSGYEVGVLEHRERRHNGRRHGYEALPPVRVETLERGQGHAEGSLQNGGSSARDFAKSPTTLERTIATKVTTERFVAKLQKKKELAPFDARANRTVKHLDGRERAGMEFDIPEDTYGAAILAVVKEMQEIYRGKTFLSLARCAFALGLLVINLLSQFCILIFISSHVVQPAVHHVQRCYLEFHKFCFDHSGNFQPDKWHTYEGKSELCQIAMANSFFYWTILFIWITSMLNEFRTIEHFFSNVYRMPYCEHGGEMMLVENGQNISIIGLTRHTRIMLFCFVCVPKLAISAMLLIFGCQWLSATTSFEDLVMNTVAMEFVVHIDELLYNAFVPPSYKQQVRDINFWLFEEEGAEDADGVQFMWSVAYLFAAFAGLVVYTQYLEDVLPSDISDVRAHCRNFYAEMQPICKHRLAGRGSECYPYGEGVNRSLSTLVSGRRLRGVFG